MGSLIKKIRSIQVKKFNYKSVVVKWTVSYICLLIITLIINFVLYNVTKVIIENEIIKANRTMISIFKDNIDSLYVDIRTTVSSITNNKRIRQLATMSVEKFDENYAISDDVSKELLSLSSIFKNFEDVYLYFDQVDLVITPSNVLSSSLYHKGFNENLNLTYVQWHDLITNDSKNTLIKQTLKDGKIQYYYVSKLPLTLTYGRQYASLVILVNDDFFVSRGRKLQEVNNASVMMVDMFNNVIRCSENELNIEIDFSKFQNKNELIHYEQNGKEYIVSFEKSDINGVTYVSAIPASNFWMKLIYIKNINIIGILIMILVSGAMTYYFVRKNYDPIGALLKNIRYYQAEKQLDDGDEYNIIQTAFSNALSTNMNMQRMLGKQQLILKKNYLSRLLHGKITDYTLVHEILESYMIQFISDKFLILIYSIKDVADFLSQKERDNGKSFELVNFIMTNVIEELFCKENYGVMLETEDYLACIVNVKGDISDQAAYEEVKRINAFAEKFLLEQFGICYDIAASNIHTGIKSISAAYDEALVALEYKVVLGNNDKFVYCEIFDDKQDSKNKYSFENESILVEKIKTGEFEIAKNLIVTIIRTAIEESVSQVVVKFVIYDMMSTVIRLMNDIHPEFNSEEILNRFSQTNKISELQEELIAFLSEVCESAKLRSSATTQLVKRVNLYIDLNYKDSNLSVTKIAQYMKMNPSYLSTTYKEQTGEGILEKINNVRISHAAQILSETNVNVNEAAESVGYLNFRTFSRLFKKRYGLTPSQYKETT